MDLKTIALDPRPAVAEHKEFNLGTNDGLREESATTDTGKEYWTGYRCDGGFFGCWAGLSEAF